ncbi:hypothetical protein BC629DRAFT_1442640 [Irpex lacteus]|nr:hypothetical protein BC629DRAFT_1442640 [Irpex lacteus]
MLVWTRRLAVLYNGEQMTVATQEVNYIWAENGRVYLDLRGQSIFYLILVILALSPTPNYIRSRSCLWIIRLVDAFQLLQFLALALFTGLRAFALCGQNILVFIIVFGLSAVPFATDMLGYIKSVIIFEEAFPTSICEAPTDLPQSLQLRAVIAADVIVLLVTWPKTFGIIRQSKHLKERMPLTEVLLRDGTVFFVALLAINIFQLLIHSISSWSALLPGSAFLAPLTSIIVSRFFFNLRQADARPGHMGDSAFWSTIHFNSNVIGNLSEPLSFGASTMKIDSHALDVV